VSHTIKLVYFDDMSAANVVTCSIYRTKGWPHTVTFWTLEQCN